MWAANSPNLQEDFAWRHNHVITRRGQGDHHEVLRPADRAFVYDRMLERRTRSADGSTAFPEDFDGLIRSPPSTTSSAGSWPVLVGASGER